MRRVFRIKKKAAAVRKEKADEHFVGKRLTSYSSHAGLTSKLWILPDGKAISIPGQHYEWALKQAAFLQERYRINLRNVRREGDTSIRLYLLQHGCVRVNYEHKGGRLTCEANYLKWGARQIKGCRAIIRANAADISFVVVRLLNSRCSIVQEKFANLMQSSVAAVIKTLPPRQSLPGGSIGERNGRQRKESDKKP